MPSLLPPGFDVKHIYYLDIASRGHRGEDAVDFGLIRRFARVVPTHFIDSNHQIGHFLRLQMGVVVLVG